MKWRRRTQKAVKWTFRNSTVTDTAPNWSQTLEINTHNGESSSWNRRQLSKFCVEYIPEIGYETCVGWITVPIHPGDLSEDRDASSLIVNKYAQDAEMIVQKVFVLWSSTVTTISKESSSCEMTPTRCTTGIELDFRLIWMFTQTAAHCLTCTFRKSESCWTLLLQQWSLVFNSSQYFATWLYMWQNLTRSTRFLFRRLAYWTSVRISNLQIDSFCILVKIRPLHPHHSFVFWYNWPHRVRLGADMKQK